ncbi:MAG: DUF4476 domain-containing protein [Proteobacteria bacterium]|nr:DUF4476 domain-containing protein [Pseudomonadota bacterium]
MRFLKSALFTAAILAFAVPAVSYAQPHHHPGPVHSMRVDIHAAKAAVANAPFSDSKRAVVDSLVNSGNQFMCSDVREILDAIDFDDAKVYAAIKMYPNTIDKNNWFTIYSAFAFDSSKEEVRRAVGAMPPAPPAPHPHVAPVAPVPPAPRPHVAPVAPVPPAPHPHVAPVAPVPPAPHPHVVPVAPQPHPGYAPAPMHAKPRANIHGILAAIDNESFSDGKRAVVSSAAASNSFTCADVAAIIRKMTFSDDQVFAAITLYDSTIDKNNWYTIYDAVTFSSDKDKIRARLGQ